MWTLPKPAVSCMAAPRGMPTEMYIRVQGLHVVALAALVANCSAFAPPPAVRLLQRSAAVAGWSASAPIREASVQCRSTATSASELRQQVLERDKVASFRLRSCIALKRNHVASTSSRSHLDPSQHKHVGPKRYRACTARSFPYLLIVDAAPYLPTP